jgi:GrpB-like predicted nucleotidyltransferase (UPF0157 family)
MRDYTGRKYHVEEYDLAWKQRFEFESQKIKAIFNDDALDIQHVGSTSVPGMAGKPTIDILVIVGDIATGDKYNDEMKALGFEPLGDFLNKGSRLFIKNKDNSRLVNLHVFTKDNPHVIEMLKIRDYLRTHPTDVQEYSDLKKELFKKYPDDYGMYRKFKDEWMKKLIQRI